jgi:hypothetical protein
MKQKDPDQCHDKCIPLYWRGGARCLFTEDNFLERRFSRADTGRNAEKLVKESDSGVK